jgi:hypothetical protein
VGDADCLSICLVVGQLFTLSPPSVEGGHGNFAWFCPTSRENKCMHIEVCMVPSLKGERPTGSGPYGVTPYMLYICPRELSPQIPASWLGSEACVGCTCACGSTCTCAGHFKSRPMPAAQIRVHRQTPSTRFAGSWTGLFTWSWTPAPQPQLSRRLYTKTVLYLLKTQCPMTVYCFDSIRLPVTAVAGLARNFTARKDQGHMWHQSMPSRRYAHHMHKSTYFVY